MTNNKSGVYVRTCYRYVMLHMFTWRVTYTYTRRNTVELLLFFFISVFIFILNIKYVSDVGMFLLLLLNVSDV